MLFDVDRAALSRRELLLLRRLENEYTPALLRDVLKPLITQTSPVSLRALDWCVTNWAKQHNVVCSGAVPGAITNVHHAYRTTLAFWKRKLFDPFRRRLRVAVRIDGEVHETTLGQANFALWSYTTVRASRTALASQSPCAQPPGPPRPARCPPAGRSQLRARTRGCHRSQHERGVPKTKAGAPRGDAPRPAAEALRAHVRAAVDVRRLRGAHARRLRLMRRALPALLTQSGAARRTAPLRRPPRAAPAPRRRALRPPARRLPPDP